LVALILGGELAITCKIGDGSFCQDFLLPFFLAGGNSLGWFIVKSLGGVRVSGSATIQQTVQKWFKEVDFSSEPWEPAGLLLNLNCHEAPLEALHHWFKFRFYVLRSITPLSIRLF